MDTIAKLRAFAQSMIDEAAHQVDEVGHAGAHEAVTVAGVCERMIAMIDERPVELPITAVERIPPDLRLSLDLYATAGVMPGAFLFAVLSNELIPAFSRADPDAMVALPAIATYVDCHLPAGSWGSRDLVRAWIARVRS